MTDLQEETCKAIGLSCHPALGLYSQDIYYILPSESHPHATPPSLPFPLIAELQRSELTSTKMTYCTVVSDGRFLVQLDSDRIAVNVLFHSYAFYDAEEGSDHKCHLPAAVYPGDSVFSAFSTPPNHYGDFLCTNPTSIFSDRCKTEVYIHPRDQVMCCSPDNAKVRINVRLPVAVFFTLCLIPYKGSIVRGNVARHVVIMDESAGMTREVRGMIGLGESQGLRSLILENIDNPEIVKSALTAALSGDLSNGSASYELFLHHLTWELSNRPDIPNFGSSAYLHHAASPESPLSALWLRQLTVHSAIDVLKWLQVLS